MFALGRVWTAPWQELPDAAAALVGCGHVSGLFVLPMWPLVIMLCADRVPIDYDVSRMICRLSGWSSTTRMRSRSGVFLVGLGYHGCGCASLIDNSFA